MVVVGNSPVGVEGLVEIGPAILVGVDQLGDLGALDDEGFSALGVNPDTQRLVQAVREEGPFFLFDMVFPDLALAGADEEVAVGSEFHAPYAKGNAFGCLDVMNGITGRDALGLFLAKGGQMSQDKKED